MDSARMTVWAEIFTRARKAQDAHDERLAKILYDSVIALDPRNSMAYFQRAMVQHNLSDEAASRADLQKSLELGNTMAASFLSGPDNLANMPVAPGTADKLKRAEELNASGMAKLSNGDTAAALRELKEAAELGSESAGFLSQALESMRFRDSVNRIRKREQRRRDPPLHEEALMLLGIIAVVSVGFLIWIKATPPGLTPDDELRPGEKVLWFGAPRQGFYIEVAHVGAILFVFLWFGVLYIGQGFRLARLLYDPQPFLVFQLLFVLIGVWMLVGRYFIEVRNRKLTTYMLTDQRALITRGSFIVEHDITALADLEARRHRDGTTTLASGALPGLFKRIADGEHVRDLIAATLQR